MHLIHFAKLRKGVKDKIDRSDISVFRATNKGDSVRN